MARNEVCTAGKGEKILTLSINHLLVSKAIYLTLLLRAREVARPKKNVTSQNNKEWMHL